MTARLLTNCSNTLRNIHTNARENITRTHAKQKVGYIFVAHPVHEVLVRAPATILKIFFCMVKLFVLLEKSPLKNFSILYNRTDQKYAQ